MKVRGGGGLTYQTFRQAKKIFKKYKKLQKVYVYGYVVKKNFAKKAPGPPIPLF